MCSFSVRQWLHRLDSLLYDCALLAIDQWMVNGFLFLFNCQMCLDSSVLFYNAEGKENNNSQLYIGLTEPPFKLRYNNHTQSFKHEKHQNSTELSKHIWQLKRNKESFTIHWSIASRAQSYNSESKRCNLCVTEKLHILNAEKHSLLNNRPELISKCRHENKCFLRNFKRDNT